MVRHAAVVLAMLCLNPSWVHAQGNALTITAASANVYKAPSTGSPVIGRAVRGDALTITREVGDWVKVAWPSDPSGAGYVRLNMGSRGPASAATTATRQGRASEPARRTAAIAPEPIPRTSARTGAGQAPTVSRQLPTTYVARPSHVVGVGGRINGPSLGIGGSVRAWSPGWLGVQFEVSHFTLETPLDQTRMTSTQFAPSVLFRPTDVMSDYVWMRPYAGAGVSLHRSTLTTPEIGFASSDSRLGFQMFGGAEFTMASVPALGVSVDYGYRRFESPFVGFDLGGTSFAISGHWYVK